MEIVDNCEWKIIYISGGVEDGFEVRISEIIDIKADDMPASIEYRIIESIKEDGYKRQLIEYNSNGDIVIAFLLIPEFLNNNPAILINHQHNSEHHLGKSEVCG